MKKKNALLWKIFEILEIMPARELAGLLLVLERRYGGISGKSG